MRIVSLLPAATEIVCALGLADHLVGVTLECDWPPEVAGTPVVTRRIDASSGGETRERERLFEIDDAALAAARPDLVLYGEGTAAIAGGPRRVAEAVAASGSGTSLLAVAPASIEGIFNAIVTVGAMTSSEDAALAVVEELRARLSDIEGLVQDRRADGQPPVRVVALEHVDPPFAVGRWIPEQIRRAGGWDLLGGDGGPAVETSWEAVREVDPEMIVLVPGALHLQAAIREWERAPRPPFWRTLDAVRRGQVFAADGASYFGRPGPRVIEGIALLAEIFDPDAFVEVSPVGSWTPIA